MAPTTSSTPAPSRWLRHGPRVAGGLYVLRPLILFPATLLTVLW